MDPDGRPTVEDVTVIEGIRPVRCNVVGLETSSILANWLSRATLPVLFTTIKLHTSSMLCLL